MPGADAPKPARRPRGAGARMRRIRLLQEMERAGLLAYLALERPEPSPNKTSTSFKIRVGKDGREKVLTGSAVESYVSGMLDAMRVLGRLPADLDKATRELLDD